MPTLRLSATLSNVVSFLTPSSLKVSVYEVLPYGVLTTRVLHQPFAMTRGPTWPDRVPIATCPT